jgi:hypothetical protein
MSSSLPIVARVSHETFTIQSRFPIHRIYCIGRNYQLHAKEMGYGDREDPFFFQKPADAVVDTFRKCSPTNQTLEETTDDMCRHVLTDSGSLALRQCIIPVRKKRFVVYLYGVPKTTYDPVLYCYFMIPVSSNDLIVAS